MEKDMTVGSPLRLLLGFSIPLFLGNLFQQVYATVDTIVVGRFVGVDALAALGAVGGFSFMVVGFSIGLGNGFAVIVSQAFGARDERLMKKSYAMSIILSLVIGVIISALFALFSKPLLILVNTPSNIIDMANDYIMVIYIGLITNIYYNLFASILRAVGDSKSPVLFLVVSSILNVVLDLALVLVIPLGCTGVALATVLSQGISAVICFFYINRKLPILRPSRDDFRIDSHLITKLLRIGLPGAFQFSVCAIGVIIVQIAINSFGSDIVAAYSVGNKIENLLSQFFPALGMAISTFAAQNLGAVNIKRIRQGFRYSMGILIVWSAIAFVLAHYVTRPMAYLFLDAATTDPSIIENAQIYTNTVVIFFIPLGMIFLFRTGSQGLGSGSIPMISSVTELVIRSAAAFTLPVFLGYQGVCLASPAAWIGAGFLLPFCYQARMGKIEKHLMIEQK
ncbi:MAG: MATE family efflux transporter [Bullifex sp.]